MRRPLAIVAASLLTTCVAFAAGEPDVRSLEGTEETQVARLHTTVPATVVAVDRRASVVGVRVGSADVRMPVAPEMARALRPGARLTLDVVVVARAHTAVPPVPAPTPPERGVHDPGAGGDRPAPGMRGPLRPGR